MQYLATTSVTRRSTFRDCRRRWYLSDVRLLEPDKGAWALAFGTCVHAGLEAYYRSMQALQKMLPGDHDPLSDALTAFHNAHGEEERALRDSLGALFTEDVEREWFEFHDLGQQMLSNYEKAWPRDQQEWEIVAVEGEVEVPILYPGTRRRVRGQPRLTGRLDLTVRRHGSMRGLWVVDHKTAASPWSDRGLDFDDQVTGYCYMKRRTSGETPRGVILNVLVKDTPAPPRVLKAGGLSTDKSQRTTLELYDDALRALNLDAGDYAEMRAALQVKGWSPWFQRLEVLRSPTELDSFEGRLFQEYKAMTEVLRDERKAYPNPSERRCPSCDFARVCQAMEDGSDAEAIIETQYHRRVEDEWRLERK